MMIIERAMRVLLVTLVSASLLAGCTGLGPPTVDRDVLSKRAFYFLMLMFSFTERSDNLQALPVLTVPTN